MLLFVVKLALVVFSVSVLAAVYIVALAREAKQSYLAFALPAEALVNLHNDYKFLKFLPALVALGVCLPLPWAHRLKP